VDEEAVFDNIEVFRWIVNIKKQIALWTFDLVEIELIYIN
jgi:hypothetical protein